jgi:hypothetical protein
VNFLETIAPGSDNPAMSRTDWFPAFFLRWLAAPLVALGVVFLLAIVNRGEEWNVVEHQGGVVILADDRPVPVDDPGALHQAFRTARHLRTDDSTRVTLALGDLLSLDVAPGSRIGCPNTPGRLVDNEITLTVIEGSLGILKGPGFGGRRLVAFTPEVRMEIGASLSAVQRHAEESRVGVYDGEVRLGSALAGPPLVVPAGKSARIRAGGTPEIAGDLDATLRARLARMRERGFH